MKRLLIMEPLQKKNAWSPHYISGDCFPKQYNYHLHIPLKKVKKDNLNIKYTGVKGKYLG